MERTYVAVYSETREPIVNAGILGALLILKEQRYFDKINGPKVLGLQVQRDLFKHHFGEDEHLREFSFGKEDDKSTATVFRARAAEGGNYVYPSEILEKAFPWMNVEIYPADFEDKVESVSLRH